MAQAVVAAAEKMRAPVILATTSQRQGMPPCRVLRHCARTGRGSRVPVAMHLDHGDSYEIVETALKSGYSSVMIDGSKLGFEDNIALGERCVAAAKPFGVPVEAELGKVGGKEMDTKCPTPATLTRFRRQSSGGDGNRLACHRHRHGTRHIQA